MIQIDLFFQSSFCNAWPEIQIEANRKKIWRDFIIGSQRIKVQFPSQDHNTVRVGYLNKRHGPDIWDVRVDNDGNIIEDQHCILKNVLIDGARCQWLTEVTPYHYPDRESKLNFGFMDAVGYMEFSFPKNVYQWILDYRRSVSPSNARASSLDYKNIYVPQNENTKAFEIINEVKSLLENCNA